MHKKFKDGIDDIDGEINSSWLLGGAKTDSNPRVSKSNSKSSSTISDNNKAMKDAIHC